MKNLLNSTGITTLFLDWSTNIRLNTDKLTGIFKSIQPDIGRRFNDHEIKLHEKIKIFRAYNPNNISKS